MLENFLTNQLNRNETCKDPGFLPVDWEALHLECKHWTDATLELRLEVGDRVICRSLATRHGLVFLDDTGPDWARELLEEAAEEWRRRLPIVHLPLSLLTWIPLPP